MKLPILLVLLGNHPTFVASSTLQAIVAAKKLRGVVKQRSSPRVDKTDASDNKGHNSLRASPSVESHGVVDEEYLDYLDSVNGKDDSSMDDYRNALSADDEDELSSDPIVEAIEALEAIDEGRPVDNPVLEAATYSGKKVMKDSGKVVAVDSSEDDNASASSDDVNAPLVARVHSEMVDSISAKNKEDAEDHRKTRAASPAVQSHRTVVDEEYASYLDSLSSATNDDNGKEDNAKGQKKRTLRDASPLIHSRIRVDEEYASYHDAVNVARVLRSFAMS